MPADVEIPEGEDRSWLRTEPISKSGAAATSPHASTGLTVAQWEIERLDRALDETLKERDDVIDIADRLAFALGGAEVGEHSNANDPWENALEIGSRDRDAARATAASLEAEGNDLRAFLVREIAKASRDSDYGMNPGPIFMMRALEGVLDWLDEYRHERAEGVGSGD